jgi:hypothetical protein
MLEKTLPFIVQGYTVSDSFSVISHLTVFTAMKCLSRIAVLLCETL